MPEYFRPQFPHFQSNYFRPRLHTNKHFDPVILALDFLDIFVLDVSSINIFIYIGVSVAEHC